MSNKNIRNRNKNTGNSSFEKYLIPENFNLKAGFFFIVIGILWMGKKVGWFEQDIFGPLVMLTIGIWFLCSYAVSRIDSKINSWTSSLRLREGDYYGL